MRTRAWLFAVMLASLVAGSVRPARADEPVPSGAPGQQGGVPLHGLRGGPLFTPPQPGALLMARRTIYHARRRSRWRWGSVGVAPIACGPDATYRDMSHPIRTPRGPVVPRPDRMSRDRPRAARDQSQRTDGPPQCGCMHVRRYTCTHGRSKHTTASNYSCTGGNSRWPAPSIRRRDRCRPQKECRGRPPIAASVRAGGRVLPRSAGLRPTWPPS